MSRREGLRIAKRATTTVINWPLTWSPHRVPPEDQPSRRWCHNWRLWCDRRQVASWQPMPTCGSRSRETQILGSSSSDRQGRRRWWRLSSPLHQRTGTRVNTQLYSIFSRTLPTWLHKAMVEKDAEHRNGKWRKHCVAAWGDLKANHKASLRSVFMGIQCDTQVHRHPPTQKTLYSTYLHHPHPWVSLLLNLLCLTVLEFYIYSFLIFLSL